LIEITRIGQGSRRLKIFLHKRTHKSQSHITEIAAIKKLALDRVFGYALAIITQTSCILKSVPHIVPIFV